jgi:hypothetical protein
VALLLGAALLTAAASAGAAEAVHYTNESLAEYEHQLSAHQIESVVFNKRLRSLHLTLKDGTHALVHYHPRESHPIEATLAAKHVPFTILSTAQANKEVKKKPHKLRYIVGGVVVVVIVIVGGVLLFNRRRQALRD